MRKQLLITFDYELFLGNRSGFVDSCMLEPTIKLMAILKKYGAKAVFFVDTTYLMCLRSQAKTHAVCAADFEKVAAQLCQLVAEGHFVYPHIHPHWLDAVYNPANNQWSLNNTQKYLFQNLTPEQQHQSFDGSVEILKTILHPQFPGYKVDAFRAGGWGIQPFKNFIPFFEKHGMKYEFSVLKDFYQFTDAQYFDFSVTPEKLIYRFNKDVCVEESAGPYIQYTISSIPVSDIVAMINKIWTKLHFKLTDDHTFHKGEGQPSRILSNVTPANHQGKNLSNSQWERIAIELLTIVKLPLYLRFMEKNHYMHFISHPKMITNHNLSIFDKFLEKVFNKYSIETDFHMMNPQ